MCSVNPTPQEVLELAHPIGHDQRELVSATLDELADVLEVARLIVEGGSSNLDKDLSARGALGMTLLRAHFRARTAHEIAQRREAQERHAQSGRPCCEVHAGGAG